MNMASEKAFVIDPDLILLRVPYPTREEILTNLGRKLEEKGYAKKGYTEALLQREVDYPTGINTGTIGVAIPHTDAIHVNETTIAVAVLDNSIEFEEMGGMDGTVDVEIVLVLVVSDPKVHLSFLQKLMGMFQEKETLLRMKEAKEPSEIQEILSKLI
ncbi:PTS sugar transporter subunit IIA [Ectobacillus funiculus]|uniref:PTS sugar transporter subunit IIA n=1 Tax=Ectobacillus funiculus TaxID=137993 RepID=UPI0039786600